MTGLNRIIEDMKRLKKKKKPSLNNLLAVEQPSPFSCWRITVPNHFTL